MLKRTMTIALLFVLALAVRSEAKNSAKKPAPAAPDKAYLQAVWDSWATLHPENAAKYYATTGPHTFYDIAPLKYSSWDEYQKGSTALIANYKSVKFTVNDDAEIHPHGDLVWVTATVADQMTTTGGKVEMGNFRWTAIFENEGGKWLIVHEHVSAPLQ